MPIGVISISLNKKSRVLSFYQLESYFYASYYLCLLGLFEMVSVSAQLIGLKFRKSYQYTDVFKL